MDKKVFTPISELVIRKLDSQKDMVDDLVKQAACRMVLFFEETIVNELADGNIIEIIKLPKYAWMIKMANNDKTLYFDAANEFCHIPGRFSEYALKHFAEIIDAEYGINLPLSLKEMIVIEPPKVSYLD